ncbi:MAG: ABC transporter permease [Anaerolineaceae bacterium]|nr:ABC transporter permease [Anaerolineaceae bacterium]
MQATNNHPSLVIKRPERGPLREFIRGFRRNLSGMIGLGLLLFFVLISLAGALKLTPFPILEQHPRDRLKAPGVIPAYILGTDQFGRDVASNIMKGGANSLEVATLSVLVATLAGTLIGALAGYIGGSMDTILMRLMDILFAFPSLLLALLIVTIRGPGLENTILAIAIVYTPIFARVARGPVLSLKETEFVTAARCIGASETRILLRHVIPNMFAPLIVQVSLALSWAIITEAGLSFLGLGTQSPEPSWGLMLSSNRGLAEIAPWLILYPGLAIMLSVLGFNLFGDGLRDVLDPRMRGRE